MNRLLEKDSVFSWCVACAEAFDSLKRALGSAPILGFPDFTRPFIVDTDASNYGLGAVLSQIDPETGERHIHFASRTLNRAERRYSTTRKELLAVVWALKTFRPHLLGVRFLLRTDHNALVWLTNFKEPEGQVARWLEFLAEYTFDIEHRSGKKHQNADALSRREPASTDVPADSAKPADVHVRTLELEPGTDHLDAVRRDCRVDPDLAVVIHRLSSNLHGFFPGDSKEVRSLMSQETSLQLRDGLLYRKFVPTNPGGLAVQQLVVPRLYRKVMFREAHAGPTSGHFGHKRTLEKLRQSVYWPGMSRDVEEWCRACAVCASRRNPVPRSQIRAPLGHIAASYPFERIAMDLMGPLPVTGMGNRHILVVCDYFSKWVELLALLNIKAETVAERVVEDVFSRFGIPESLHTDQGKQFESGLFQELCRLLGIEKTRTTPYHPQSDGLVERANRTVQNVLAAYVSDHQGDWDCFLAQTQLAYNTSQHSPTGYTPYFLLFGREARLPLSILADSPSPPEVAQTLPEYVVDLRDRLVEAYDRVRERLDASHRRQKEFYDRSAAAATFCVGDRVWLFTPVVKKERTHKFNRPWSGPWEIEEVLNAAVYRLVRHGVLNAGERRRQVVHRDRLKPYETPSVVPQPPRVYVPPPVVEPVEDSDSSESASDSTSESEDESLLAPLPPTCTGRVRSRPTRFADFTCH